METIRTRLLGAYKGSPRNVVNPALILNSKDSVNVVLKLLDGPKIHPMDGWMIPLKIALGGTIVEILSTKHPIGTDAPPLHGSITISSSIYINLNCFVLHMVCKVLLVDMEGMDF
jgi:hypothetical protein